MMSEGLKHLIIAACLLAILHYSSAAVVDQLNGRKVLLISMDGFRYDYLERTRTPYFDAMIASGVTVPYVNATFVTLTFPSHTSIATGLFQESHGMIGNTFYDPLYDSQFSMRTLDEKWWNMSEPMWTTAVRAGLKVGTFFWPGSDVSHKGIQPHDYRAYDFKVHYLERINTAVNWLTNENYDFTIIYFNEPDYSGHRYGPEDPHMRSVIQLLDTVVGLLMMKLTDAKIKDKVDIIITSDHGMATIDMKNRVVDISDYVSKDLLKWTIPKRGVALNLVPQPNKSRELVEVLNRIDHVNAFLKEDIPERFHYKNNRRVMPVFAYADEGWYLTSDKKYTKSSRKKGNHGFDNDLMSMKAFFVASGPSFKSGYRLPEPIKSVDIYPLLCHLLNLTPNPNNGSFGRVMPLLQESPADSATVFVSILTNWLVCLVLCLVYLNAST